MKKAAFILILTMMLTACQSVSDSVPKGTSSQKNTETSPIIVTTSAETAAKTTAETPTETPTETSAETTSVPIFTATEKPLVTKVSETPSDDKVFDESGAEIDNDWAFFLVNQSHLLDENYSIDTTTVYESYMKFKMDSRMADYMLKMLADAKKDGINLTICSAYRSLEKQKSLFNNDVEKYKNQGYSKEEAYAMTAKNVAIPGQSEHQTGLAADILSDEFSSLSEKFDTSKAFKWLDENAYKYGFILRYPKDKTEITGISYEPWHYRFVGLYHAKEIKNSGKCLEEYFQ
ncbi:MAG: M15 family metallopeptidase [Oscillospiraceae bacterium]